VKGRNSTFDDVDDKLMSQKLRLDVVRRFHQFFWAGSLACSIPPIQERNIHARVLIAPLRFTRRQWSSSGLAVSAHKHALIEYAFEAAQCTGLVYPTFVATDTRPCTRSRKWTAAFFGFVSQPIAWNLCEVIFAHKSLCWSEPNYANHFQGLGMRFCYNSSPRPLVIIKALYEILMKNANPLDISRTDWRFIVCKIYWIKNDV